nr:MAG TPA: hypothetical protein [Caudoviricetes sp.]
MESRLPKFLNYSFIFNSINRSYSGGIHHPPFFTNRVSTWE